MKIQLRVNQNNNHHYFDKNGLMNPAQRAYSAYDLVCCMMWIRRIVLPSEVYFNLLRLCVCLVFLTYSITKQQQNTPKHSFFCPWVGYLVTWRAGVWAFRSSIIHVLCVGLNTYLFLPLRPCPAPLPCSASQRRLDPGHWNTSHRVHNRVWTCSPPSTQCLVSPDHTLS